MLFAEPCCPFGLSSGLERPESVTSHLTLEGRLALHLGGCFSAVYRQCQALLEVEKLHKAAGFFFSFSGHDYCLG